MGWWRRNKPVENTKPKSYKRIKNFDENEYIRSVFNHVFHSIRIDDGWARDSEFSEMIFKKRPEGGGYSDEVCLKIKYEDYTKFEIKSIYLISREVYTFDVRDMKTDDYDFFYNCYVDLINESNRIKKERADEALSKIHNILGKSSIRDSKIDDLLS